MPSDTSLKGIRMKLSGRTLLFVGAVVIASVVGVRLFSRFTEKNADVQSNQSPIVVRVNKVVKGDIVDQIKISGTIRPNHEVDIYPKMPGRVIALKFDVGDKVNAGDVLAVIEHDEAELQEKSAKASLAMAKTNEAAAKIELERARELFVERAMTKAELEAIEQKYSVAKAQARAAIAQADIATQQLKNATITSLTSGTVTNRNTTLGAHVSPQAPIFAVQDISKLKFVTSVDAQTLLRLKKGTRAALSFDQIPDEVTGHVKSVAPSLDLQSRRGEIEIEIDDKSGKLVPNMFIDGALILSTIKDVLIVPNRAVVTDTKTPRLFRVVDGRVHVVNPRLGPRDNVHSQILDGLALGDLIAVSGLDRLREGSVVAAELEN